MLKIAFKRTKVVLQVNNHSRWFHAVAQNKLSYDRWRLRIREGVVALNFDADISDQPANTANRKSSTASAVYEM